VAAEPTALGWLKVRHYVEVPEQDRHLSLFSYMAVGWWLVILR